MTTNSVDFNDAASWAGLSADQTSLTASGLTVQATGGVLSQFHGLSVESPNDNTPEGWTHEIDAWNDTPESVTLNFDQPQSSVTITLAQLYYEWIWIVEPEKAEVTLTFSDGTTLTGEVWAETGKAPGEVTITIGPEITEGRTITSMFLTPSTDLAQVPAPNPRPGSANFQRPFSEFTLRSVEFTHDNAPVVITCGENGGVVEIIGTPAAGASLQSVGQLTFTDADIADHHTLSVAPTGTPLGVLTLALDNDSTGGGAGHATWTYNVDASKLEYLQAGQTVIESFTVTVDDGQGGVATRQVDITLTGTNDVPTINAAETVAVGAVAEQTNTTGSSAIDTAVGVVAFKDVDLLDTHTAAVAPVGSTLGSLVLGPVGEGGGAGALGWTYQVEDKKLDYLAAGQQKVEVFNVTVDDGHGGTATQAITITLTGANDLPVFTVPSVTTGTIADKADTGCFNGYGCWSDWFNDCFSYGSSLSTTTGKLYFKDVDLTDTHTLSVTPAGSTLGSLTLSNKTESNGSGSLSWSYKVADSKLEYLGAGETRQEVFNVRLDDGHGGVTIQPITITLVGVNDGPTAVNNCFSVNANAATGNLWSSILANDHDPDKSDVLTITSVNTSRTDGMVLLNTTTKSLIYVADADSFATLGKGHCDTDSFTYTISDGHGGFDSATVSVNISGVADTKVGGNSADTVTLTAASVYDALKGDDKVTGSTYADVLMGGDGNDMLLGAGGNDVLYGQAGDDKLDGGLGDDVLLGGAGKNTLTGGAGSDFFVFSDLTTKDTVTDFALGVDHLYFQDGLTVTSLKQAGGNTTLTLSGGDQVVLLGVTGVSDWHAFL